VTEGTSADQQYVGRLVNERYTTTALIGAGGMGAVYRAHDAHTGLDVALKRLRPEYRTDSDIVRRFVIEGSTTQQIVHPNVVNVVEIGQDHDDGSLYIVQEFLVGEDLRQRLRREQRIVPELAVAWMTLVADGLAVAHNHGVVHRDIKPANIFLADEADGSVSPKVIDFGVSKVLGPIGEGMSRTRTGVMVGTPQFMSPEQVRAERPLDERVDIWSLGIVMHIALAGEHPFKAENVGQVFLKIISQPAPRLDAIVPGVSAELADVVQHMLQRDRNQRFQTMRAVVNALRSCRIPSRSLPPIRVSRGEPAAMFAQPHEHTRILAAATPAPAGAMGARGSWRRRLAWLAVFALGVLAVASVVAWRVRRHPGRAPIILPVRAAPS
jgi:serine/threonine-protein kinase